MNVEHQVLQIGVNARQRVNRGLLIGNQVVELHNTDRYCLQLLGFNHDLLYKRVLNHLVCHNHRKVAGFSHIPPVVTEQRRVCIVTQALGKR